MEKYMMKVDRCCCCFEILTGTRILVVLGLIGSVLQLLRSIGALAVAENDSQVPAEGLIILRLISFYMIIHWIVFGVIPCGLGVVAVFNNKPSYLKPYIFVSIFELLMLCVCCLVVLLLSITSGDLLRQVAAKLMEHQSEGKQVPDLVSVVIGLLISLIVMILFNWYFLSVVYMCYKQMNERANGSRGAQYSSAPPEYNAYMKS